MSVVIETTIGDITVDLFLKERPRACLNFLKLCKLKYYNLNLFHFIDRNFIAQTGDPSGAGDGGESVWGVLEGQEKRYFEGETIPRIKHSAPGLISFVGDADRMIGSQFFLTLAADLYYLDNRHCVFGEVVEGHDILEKLNEVICDDTHRPYQDVRITHTVVLDDPFPDPPGLQPPDMSPEPTAERLKGGRIAPDEEVDETSGKSAKEINELIEEKAAKARATILEMIGDIPDAEMAPPENVLFVCKLNPVTNDKDLEIIFSRFGKIVTCEVIRDKKTGDSLQYAFIEFAEKKSCEDAYFKMDNVLIDDRRIHVDFSQSVSKIRWLGKGRGVSYYNDKGEKKDKPSDDFGSGKYERRREKRSRSRSRSRENRNFKNKKLNDYNERVDHRQHTRSETNRAQQSEERFRPQNDNRRGFSRNRYDRRDDRRFERRDNTQYDRRNDRRHDREENRTHERNADRRESESRRHDREENRAHERNADRRESENRRHDREENRTHEKSTDRRESESKRHDRRANDSYRDSKYNRIEAEENGGRYNSKQFNEKRTKNELSEKHDKLANESKRANIDKKSLEGKSKDSDKSDRKSAKKQHSGGKKNTSKKKDSSSDEDEAPKSKKKRSKVSKKKSKRKSSSSSESESESSEDTPPRKKKKSFTKKNRKECNSSDSETNKSKKKTKHKKRSRKSSTSSTTDSSSSNSSSD